VTTVAASKRSILRPVRTTPGLVRTLTALVLLTVGVLGVIGTLAINSARESVRVIGHGAGPQVVATGDLYYALSDMNAQAANILLAGREHNLGISRDAALQRYERRRTQASRATMQATTLAGNDKAQRAKIRDVLDGIGRYERLASQAMILDERTDPSEPLPQQAIELYRDANSLMADKLLPEANDVTEQSDKAVQRTYERSQSQVSSLLIWIAISGLCAVLALIGLQVYLSVRFRRILNPALVLATLATFALVVTSLLMLTTARESVTRAKTEGHDKILSVSRSRAANNTLQANEAIYRLDVRQNIESESKLRGIEERMGPLVDGFASTDRIMVQIIKDHQGQFERAIAEADRALNGWHLIFPGGAAGIALLVLIGVRPRLAEYR
jgi:CHASE3 domain sensor protein